MPQDSLTDAAVCPSHAPSSVSVIVPAYNHRQYLRECVESIWSQPHRPLELIVIDDGSTDGTGQLAEELARSAPISMQVFQQANQGLVRTLNRGLELASGELIAIIASDDKFLPNRFARQVKAFAEDANLQLVIGNGLTWYADDEQQRFSRGSRHKRIHDEKMQSLLSLSAAEIEQSLYRKIPTLFLQACLFRRSLLNAIGRFDERLAMDDWPTFIRIFRHLAAHATWQHRYIDEDVLLYRQHAENNFRKAEAHLKRIEDCIESHVPLEFQAPLKAHAYAKMMRMSLKAGDHIAARQWLNRSQQQLPQPGLNWQFFWRRCVGELQRLLKRTA